VYCPTEILEAFIDLSRSNTDKSVETCGILAGREVNKGDSLLIDALIIPIQEGYVDRCLMTDELSLFEAQIDRKVMTIGWIHSHPTYVRIILNKFKDLFLSSVDLHNQLGYQLQLPEALAIVYSPISKLSQTKAFRLRDDSVADIQTCKQGGFHEHIIENNSLERHLPYQECQHIKYIKAQDYGISVEIIDLRYL
jgi:STAM-binding protein